MSGSNKPFTTVLVKLLAVSLLFVSCQIAETSPPQTEESTPVAEVTQQPTEGETIAESSGGVIIPELGRDYLAYPEITGTINFNNCWIAGREELIEQWIRDFNTFYPNITVSNDNSKDCSEILTYQKTLIEGGVPPDVLMVNSRNFGLLAEIDSLRPLNDWIERDKIDPAWFYDSEWNARQIDGQVYGLPNVTAGATRLMFYKQEYLEQAGIEAVETWQDLEALSEVANADGVFIMDPRRTGEEWGTFFELLLYANGGKLWNDEFTEISWNSPEGLQAAEWLLDFIKLQTTSYELMMDAEEGRAALNADTFASEPYISAINGSWFFYQLQEDAPDLVYVVDPFPRNANNSESMGYTPVEGGWSFAIANNISSQDQAAAWEWIKFTTVSQFAREFTVAQLRPSPVRSYNEDERLSAQNPHWDAVKASLERAEFIPVSTIHPQLQEIVANMQDAILFEQLTPAEALETYAEEAQALLDEWNREQ